MPEDELRLILGENAIRFFDLDRSHLATIAARIGPTYADTTAPCRWRPTSLSTSMRGGGYLKPAEGTDQLDKMDEMLADDLPALANL